MERVKLTNICNPKQWKTIPTSELLEDGFPVYGANGIIGYYNEFNHANSVVTITCRGATCGSINITLPKAYITGNAMCLDDVRADIKLKYLYYCLKHFDFNTIISGSAQPQITRQGLEKVEIVIGTEIEQNDVIEKLSRIERIIDLRERELNALDDLIKARFVEMFGDLADPECKWDKCRIVDACPGSDDIKCGPFGTQLNKNEYLNSGIAVWEIPQINTTFQSPPTHYVSKEKAIELKAYSIVAGDIAMSRKGNVGKCAVFPKGVNAGIIHSDVLRIRLDATRIVPEFMMRQLHYSGAVQQQIELISSGAIMAGINVTKLKEIYVHIPPKRLQDQFADFVIQVDKSKLIGLLIQQQIMRRFLYDQL